MNQGTSKSFKDLLSDVIKQGKFLGKDPDLTRYSRDELKNYVKFCCDNNYFIEAYALTLQYIEDIIFAVVKREKDVLRFQDAPKIIAVLKSNGIITEVFYNLFNKVNADRNKLSHEIIRDPQSRKIISNTKSHVDDLRNLINLAEEYFLSYVKAHPGQFLFIKKFDELKGIHKLRYELVRDVLLDITFKELDKENFKGLKEEEFKKIYKERFKEILFQKYRDIFGIK